MPNNDVKGDGCLKKYSWTTKDFGWLIFILVGIILAILTIRLGDNKDILSYISFGANAVAIALSLVAIGIAIAQNNSSQDLYSRMSETMIKVDEKITNLDYKISNLDVVKVTQALEDIKDEISTTIKEKQEIDSDELINTIDSKISEKINEVQNEAYSKNLWNEYEKHLINYFKPSITDLNYKISPTCLKRPSDKELKIEIDKLSDRISNLKRVVKINENINKDKNEP